MTAFNQRQSTERLLPLGRLFKGAVEEVNATVLHKFNMRRLELNMSIGTDVTDGSGSPQPSAV